MLSAALIVVAGGITWWNNVTFPAGEGGHAHGGAPTATAAAGHSHAKAAPATVGEKGNPALPAHIIEVAMLETGAGMAFEPSAITVARGDQVRFKITNKGALDHEFVLATLEDNLHHLEEMKRTPGMAHHDSPSAITLKPDAKGEILWRFTSAGTFDFSCLIPGHREAGMHGSIVVK
jgi:uncharacterized cupredoxin-like copper-binding protein